jgi:DNA polymerase-1
VPEDGFALLGEEKVREKWGVPAGRIGDVLAIIGDTVDNIPGIDGLGPKTAATLINEHGSLDALLANLDAVKSERTRGKLREGAARVRENREMVRLDEDLPLPVALADLQITPCWPELIAALEKCDFKGLLAEVRADAAANGVQTPVQVQPQAQRQAPAQCELFG